LALLHKGEVELALGSFDKSQMALSQVENAHSVTTAAASAAAAMHSDRLERRLWRTRLRDGDRA